LPPKSFREKLIIEEGDEVLIELASNTIVLKPLKPRVVDIDLSIVTPYLLKRREWEEKLG